jgi:Type VI secretion system/phage-baseplate injector OB domain
MSGSFPGIYRGTVINNIDPDFKGRLNLAVPDVTSLIPTTWAEPCVPLAGPTGPPMGVFMVPPIGTGVWVQFIHGDPDYPVWMGCYWGAPSDVPPLAKAGIPASPSIVLQSLTQNSIVISDVPGPAGGIMIKVAASVIMITTDGITITAPKLQITAADIKLTGITDINAGALKVT